MEYRTGVIKRYTQNFSLDEAKLTKIVDVIREQSEKLGRETFIEFYIERENDSFFKTKDLNDILQDDNTIGKSISALIIELFEYESESADNQNSQGERKTLVYVAFNPNKDIHVRVSVASERRDWTSLTMDDIDTQIKRTLVNKGISSFLRYADGFLGVLIIYAGVLLSAWFIEKGVAGGVTQFDISTMSQNEQISEILRILIEKDQISTYGFLFSWVSAFSLGLLVFYSSPISRLVSKTRSSYFCWGDMIQVHDKNIQRNTLIMWGIFIALVVSTIGSIIGTLLFALL